METRQIRPPIVAYDNPFVTLENCGGHYIRPPDGPVIATSAQYQNDKGRLLNYVVKEYYLFSMAFEHRNESGNRNVIGYWARRLINNIIIDLLDRDTKVDFFLGIPSGGYVLAQALGENFKQARVIQAIMKDGELEYIPQIKKGDQGIVVVDTANSCKTAEKAAAAAEKQGASIMALACVCTRFIAELYEVRHGTRITLVTLGQRNIPLITLAQKYIPHFKQEDRLVAGAKIIYDPEERWLELMELMAQAKR
jgi:adenine/guanine phosphoribosyltransferase-like PRPP-binding protein